MMITKLQNFSEDLKQLYIIGDELNTTVKKSFEDIEKAAAEVENRVKNLWNRLKYCLDDKGAIVNKIKVIVLDLYFKQQNNINKKTKKAYYDLIYNALKIELTHDFYDRKIQLDQFIS